MKHVNCYFAKNAWISLVILLLISKEFGLFFAIMDINCCLFVTNQLFMINANAVKN